VDAHQENIAKQPLKAQTGWSFWTDHPVRAFQRLPSALFLDGTATPPVPGGDYAIRRTTPSKFIQSQQTQTPDGARLFIETERPLLGLVTPACKWRTVG
jgi:hypothetical protein